MSLHLWQICGGVFLSSHVCLPVTCLWWYFSQAGEKGEEKKGGAKKKNKVKTVDLPIDCVVPQLNKDKLNLLTEKEVRVLLCFFVALFSWFYNIGTDESIYDPGACVKLTFNYVEWLLS